MVGASYLLNEKPCRVTWAAT